MFSLNSVATFTFLFVFLFRTLCSSQSLSRIHFNNRRRGNHFRQPVTTKFEIIKMKISNKTIKNENENEKMTRPTNRKHFLSFVFWCNFVSVM